MQHKQAAILTKEQEHAEFTLNFAFGQVTQDARKALRVTLSPYFPA
ncbi:MAG TPA: hypothetical protein VFA14_01275 [Herbaspirillum sp.]|nr:hypothetical protein [Herbaspirillum sp.]